MLKKMEENPPLVVVWEDDAPKASGASNQVTAQSLHVRCPWWSPFFIQGYNCLRWTGSIPYVFGWLPNNFSDTELVKAVEEAMQEWTDKTGGKVRFHRAHYLQWRLALLWTWWSSGVVNITRTDGYSNAYVGYGPGVRTYQISDDAFKDKNKLKAHTRHELGHIIGLLHEHQRWDRDVYLDVPENIQGITDWIMHYWNFRKIDLDSSIGWHRLVFKPETVTFNYFTCWGGLFNLTCGWRKGSFTNWYPVWEYVEVLKERTGYGSAGFDFFSVMLYKGLIPRPGILRDCPSCFAIDEEDRRVKTRLNTEVTAQDAAAAAGLVGW